MSTNLISKFFVVLIVLAVALVSISFVNRSVPVFSADRSYDSVEQVRTQPSHAYKVLTSFYNQLEALRSMRGSSPIAVDSSYALIEQVRTGRWMTADHSYDNIETLRLQR